MTTIDVKQAVRTAIAYVQSLYEYPLPGLQLEEVELSDDERYWLITVGFARDDGTARENPLRALVEPFGSVPARQRTYKIVRIDAETGAPKSMRIRDVATAE